MEQHNSKREVQQRTISTFNSHLATDLHALANCLKPLARPAAEATAALANQLLLVNAQDALPMLSKLLTHLLPTVEFKETSTVLLSILAKIISLTKIICLDPGHEQCKDSRGSGGSEEMDAVTKSIIEVVFALSNRAMEQDMSLRIVQTTYSLIQPALLRFADYTVVTRLYSVLLKCCCHATHTIQNVSASAIFTLTEIVYQHSEGEGECHNGSDRGKDTKSRQEKDKGLASILIELLQFTISRKQCEWLKDNQLRSITWDMILMIVKTVPPKEWQTLNRNIPLVQLLCELYELSVQNSFPSNPQLLPHDFFKDCIRLEGEKHHGKRDLNWDYTKSYKVFVYFSIHLSILLTEDEEVVPFRKHLGILHVLYDYQRTTRFFIILQGISLLVKHGSVLILQQEGGIMLIDIFQKVIEELYSSKQPFHISWEGSEERLEKMFDNYSHISDEDYLKLTKNTLVYLRKGLEHVNSSPKYAIAENLEMTMTCLAETQLQIKDTSLPYRWRRLIKSVIRIIRYFTSLKFKAGSNDQAIRKFIMEFQYWFLICPNHKTRNAILFELQNCTTKIENINHAIKASQCMQICSNILYGFYSMLNSVGVSIIIRILANVKICFEEGRDFNQLDEVSEMAAKFYIEERLISNEKEFRMTIEGFIQSINVVTADMQVPATDRNRKEETEKSIKIIEYVLLKFKFVIEINTEFLQNSWHFIETFWISLCSSKDEAIRGRIQHHIIQVVMGLLKSTMIEEQCIIHLYSELAKFKMFQVSVMALEQIKQLIPFFKDEAVLVSVLTILQEIVKKEYRAKIIEDVSEIEDIIIKEALFLIKSEHSLLTVISSLNFEAKGKNQEYKTVSLLWNISDHLKQLYQHSQQQKQDQLWKLFFNKIIQFTRQTSVPGTRQSCIHTFTQTIATCSASIGHKLFLQLVTEEYLEIYCLLMGFDDSVPKFDPMEQVEMVKAAIKSFVKLTKKCIHDKDTQIVTLFQTSIERLTLFIQRSGKDLPTEYYFQLCQLFSYLKQLWQQQTKGQPFVNIEHINQALTAMELQHQHLNQAAYQWKKYSLAFGELKEYFSKQ